MRHRIPSLIVLASLVLAGLAATCKASPQPQVKDYLSEEESNKIRDADTPAKRIKLYVSFADDRLKKFDYELNRPTPQRRRAEILNVLLNGYTGCMDDGSDQIDVAREKQMDIHESLKLMETKYKEFLAQLEKYDAGAPDLDMYKDTLEDAIEGTKDALSEVAEALKEMLPPPVRRKQ
jgi:hypothetical protein